jgi:hypothetical protein
MEGMKRMNWKSRRFAVLSGAAAVVIMAAAMIAGTGTATAIMPPPDDGSIEWALTALEGDEDLLANVLVDEGMEADGDKVELEREVISDLVDGMIANSDPYVSAMLDDEKEDGSAEAEVENAEFDAELAAIPPEELCGEGELVDAAPVGSAAFVSNGGYAEFIDGECVAVYAGQAGVNNAEEGAIFVVHGVAMEEVETNLITTDEAGSLSIETVDDGTVILTSNDGHEATFDIEEELLSIA